MNTSDELGIFWPAEWGHVETTGIECFGFFPKGVKEFNIAKVGDLWSGDSFDIRTTRIDVETGAVAVIMVRISTWPSDSDWFRQLERTLTFLVQLGARVSWSGGYDCNWSLDIFDPGSGAGNVYAAYSEQTGMVCNSQLSEPVVFLTDSQLETFKGLIQKTALSEN